MIFCKRKPSGRLCRILAEETTRLKIHDPGAPSTFWVSRETFHRDWMRL